MPPPPSTAAECTNNAPRAHTWHKPPTWQGTCPTVKPAHSAFPLAPTPPNSTDPNTQLQPPCAQQQPVSAWPSPTSGYATRWPQEQFSAQTDPRHWDDRSHGAQIKHAAPAQHYADMSNSPYVQLGSPNQHAQFFAPTPCHANSNQSLYDRFYLTMHLTLREIENNILQSGNSLPFHMQYPQVPPYPQVTPYMQGQNYLQMPQHMQVPEYMQEIEKPSPANFSYAAARQPDKSPPPPTCSIPLKQDQGNKSIQQINSSSQTNSTTKNYDLDLPLPRDVSYHDAKYHFIKLKKYMDISYEKISEIKKSETETNEHCFFHKGTDYLHYLFLDTYLIIVHDEKNFRPHETINTCNKKNDGGKIILTDNDRKIQEIRSPLDASETICRLGHIDNKNYDEIIARILGEEKTKGDQKYNYAKMDSIPRIDSFNIHGFTKNQCTQLIKSNSPKDTLEKMLKQKFMPKTIDELGNKFEKQQKFIADIGKYILKTHYNSREEKEIIFARITKSKNEYKIVSKNEYIKDIKSAYDNIKDYPHHQNSIDFSIADLDYRQPDGTVDQTIFDQSNSQEDYLAVEIISPISFDSVD